MLGKTWASGVRRFLNPLVERHKIRLVGSTKKYLIIYLLLAVLLFLEQVRARYKLKA